MDDSDQDFADLCSKLLKRVRKKPGESRRAEQQSSSQVVGLDKSRKNNKRTEPTELKCAWSQPVSAAAEMDEAVSRGGPGSGDAGGSDVPEAASPGQQEGAGMRAKDKVLLRMQQFKRASPQRMAYTSPTSTHESSSNPPAVSALRQESLSAGPSSEPQDSDEALALRLQQELDREAAESQIVDLEEGGLFFCQICHKDLSHMSPEGRTQHLNRCLDESEQSAQPPPPPLPPPPPGVPDCPICGKKFKSQKSRSTHLKRCSTDLGVSPAELLQAVQRQAEENQNIASASTSAQTGGTKRKGAPKPNLPANKKPRKKTDPLDEDTMVALALSSSLLEQEKEQNRERDAETEIQTASHSSVSSGLKWKPDAGKGRGKKKKAAIPRPPQLLLIQDANTALTRLQERVSALLLRSRPPSPPTPTRCPSTLPGLVGAAPLWRKSRLLDEGSTGLTDFYTAELREFITPWESRVTDAASSGSLRPESSVKNASEGTPLSRTRASMLPSSSQAASSSSSPAPSTPGTGQLPVGSQALRDLMELAEDGMTLTQCGYTASGSNGRTVGKISNLRLSGFVLEESEEQADLCMSGFLPDTTHTCSEGKQSQQRRNTDHSGAETKQSVSLCRLSSDLSSMVNNPQLSDVQLQVDSGDVFFAHSFMLYSRCPLLAEMIHESGFGVQEEGLPAAQRVLISDVPAEAVLALLRYLYTAHCSISAPLRPHVLELASRFDLQELQQMCVLHREDMATDGEEDYQEENINNQTDQALVELLRSMWNDEDEEEEGEEGAERDGNKEERLEEDHQADDLTTADVEIQEDKVNEEELEEIYEFAATQRKREDDRESMEEEEEEEEEEVFTKLTEPKRSFTDLKSQSKPDLSLDRSYNRLFSDSWGVYEEGDPSSSRQHGSPPKPSSSLSGRTLLQLSGSEAEEKSPSRPSISSNLPVLDQSPGLPPLKRESQGPQSICIPDSPKSCKEMKKPELIVLSDSSEELEDVVCPCSPTPGSHTQIKPQPIQTDKDSSQEPKSSNSLQESPESLPPAQLQSPSAECSPEVSWLIPSTPLQHIRSTSSSSTQTRSSMCRTQLFPKRDASSSSVFSSPALTSKNSITDSISRIKHEENESFNPKLDLKISSKQASRCDASQEGFTVPSSQTKAPRSSVSASSKQDILLPHSSTPLHTDLHLPQAHPAASPLSNSISKQASTGEDMELLGSPDKMELESFHLSPLSDPSSSHRGLEGLQKRSSESSRQSRSSGESNMNKNTDSELRGEDKGGDISGPEAGEAVAEANEADFSYQQSFMDMDEPPIAFNDSWGLDACMENPGRFSLRLEDSRGSSQKDQSQEGRESARSSSSSDHQPPPAALRLQSPKSHSRVGGLSPSRPAEPSTPETNGLLDSKIWDSWREEEEEEEALPLYQRLNPSAQLKTPAASKLSKRRRTLVPITPMPHYSDMDTPELKTKLNRFGVRPLPKRQMVLKLKEIHQYTHQLVSSDSDGDSPSVGRAAPAKPPTISSRAASCAQTVRFKEPLAPAVTSPLKHVREEEEEPLSASQGSNTSSTAESERSNPELCASSDGDSDSDGGISASQTASCLQDRLQAVRSFILSDSSLYTQILQYQPLVLSQLQQSLKAAGIRLGAAKLVDYLDSQCITFTTAKPGQPAPSRRRGKKTKAAGEGRVGRKKVTSAML